MTVSALHYFQHLCSLSVLFPCFCPTQVLPTFHCKVKELLVLCEGLGGKGHSGAELWVVKLTGSEQDPFTELYIAYTLETVFKWVINVLTVPVALPWPQYLTTKAPTIPSSSDRLVTDQCPSLLYFTYTRMQKKKITAEEEQCFVQIFPQTIELSSLSFLSTSISLPTARLPHTVVKSSLKYNRKKGINFNAWFTLDPHVPCWVQVSAGYLLPWVQFSPT